MVILEFCLLRLAFYVTIYSVHLLSKHSLSMFTHIRYFITFIILESEKFICALVCTGFYSMLVHGCYNWIPFSVSSEGFFLPILSVGCLFSVPVFFLVMTPLSAGAHKCLWHSAKGTWGVNFVKILHV